MYLWRKNSLLAQINFIFIDLSNKIPCKRASSWQALYNGKYNKNGYALEFFIKGDNVSDILKLLPKLIPK